MLAPIAILLSLTLAPDPPATKPGKGPAPDQAAVHERDMHQALERAKAAKAQKEAKAAREERDLSLEDGPAQPLARGGQWHFSDGRKKRRRAARAKRGPELPRKDLSRPPISAKGRYQGLRLESKTPSPVPVKLSPDEGPVLTWVGFQRDVGNRSVVFAQTDRSVEPKLTQKGRVVELFLPGVIVTQANHARSLDLRYFPQTVVRKVRTTSNDAGTTIKVRLRSSAKAQLQTRSGPSGHGQVLLSFDPAAR